MIPLEWKESVKAFDQGRAFEANDWRERSQKRWAKMSSAERFRLARKMPREWLSLNQKLDLLGFAKGEKFGTSRFRIFRVEDDTTVLSRATYEETTQYVKPLLAMLLG